MNKLNIMTAFVLSALTVGMLSFAPAVSAATPQEHCVCTTGCSCDSCKDHCHCLNHGTCQHS